MRVWHQTEADNSPAWFWMTGDPWHVEETKPGAWFVAYDGLEGPAPIGPFPTLESAKVAYLMHLSLGT